MNQPIGKALFRPCQKCSVEEFCISDLPFLVCSLQESTGQLSTAFFLSFQTVIGTHTTQELSVVQYSLWKSEQCQQKKQDNIQPHLLKEAMRLGEEGWLVPGSTCRGCPGTEEGEVQLSGLFRRTARTLRSTWMPGSSSVVCVHACVCVSTVGCAFHLLVYVPGCVSASTGLRSTLGVIP